MRLLRLDFRTTDRSVDLHPFVTVLPFLDRRERHELVEAIRQLARGSTLGLRGLLQHEGLLVDLDGESRYELPAFTTTNVVFDEQAADGDDLYGLRAEVDQQRRVAEVSAAAVEELRSEIDPWAAERVADLEAKLGPVGRSPADTERARAVEAAAIVLSGLAPTLTDVPPEVPALRERWRELLIEVESVAGHVRALGTAVDRAEQAIGRARERGDQRGLEHAKRRLDQARYALRIDPLYSGLTARMDAFRERCRPVLGQDLPDDLDAALAGLAVERANPRWETALVDLHRLIGTVDPPNPPDPSDHDEPLWCVNVRQRMGREALQAARSWLDVETVRLSEDEQLVLSAELERARDDHERHERAANRLDRAEAAATTAALELARLEEHLAARTLGDAGSLEAVLTRIENTVAQIRADAGGSLPVAFVGDLEPLDDAEFTALIGALRAYSSVIQVVLLTDRPGAQQWGQSVGPEQGMVSWPRVQDAVQERTSI
ncbi:MAG: hypothetical protein AAF467_10695 [Actinomycetota bacterium]